MALKICQTFHEKALGKHEWCRGKIQKYGHWIFSSIATKPSSSLPTSDKSPTSETWIHLDLMGVWYGRVCRLRPEAWTQK